jgi:GNAT superfamily N-acetyltransferase
MQPVSGPRRRILIEAGDADLRREAARVLEMAGFAVTACAGPTSGRPCPLLAGQTCGLVAGADVVVHALSGRRGQAVLEQLRTDPAAGPEVLVLPGCCASPNGGGKGSLQAAARGPELLAEVFRLHASRARFLRLPVTLHDGRRVVVRAVRPADADGLRAFDRGLSARSRQLRYLGSKPPMTEDWALHLTTVDFDRRFALVATTRDREAERIVADCRLLADGDKGAELAIVVSDDHQGTGLGRLLVEVTMRLAGDRGFPEVHADVRYDNRTMALLLRSEGFRRVRSDFGVTTFRAAAVVGEPTLPWPPSG